MFLGLRTVIYQVPDLEQAKAWYTAAFGVTPYFDEPFYIGFDIGGFELGLHPRPPGITVGNNAIAYWGVPDIDAALQQLVEHGAAVREPAQDVGGDIRVAAVADPFGNLIGVIQNPHFRTKG